ncbi:hypothetical protein A2630_02970 [Candidatus Woesebacteria bacterium RIFCSPHIGHO2_01_FULL_44_10]|uniref:Probable transcriptional regulatory protein A2975_02000 n=1 Tax=Candidatus Woesebacteria bacterium RIFCSPLOWO2_01_FULL_44_14 TaxID=1802525 RepID=A0A1F8C2H6_9BACT|nr:MAG: hypothetical protein A2630_02970 [Candidatus Woesebacteria bacterium RIFCSPHIGHO2_01_FULL_44_10]OGM55744.1 MAG: hypothetical protein A3F62_04660 [Candidatus Woesebacteria bacterium RIFCSPHIGHO2_12_FULL_44_11]OGM70531.1 MAG: hypothetical protein A2975_02000 [Candidatus Woesebacteria bacterium RIFCSPLOWO2_01_FULL_44_14]
MSGHSKWSTIKHKKAVTDAARGRLFSRLVKAIAIAVKTGGGADPDANPKLRVAMEAAKAANMPKVNIDRVITKASSEGENFEEVTYEGFGPGGFGVIVEAATDNRNRTGQEIKSIFEKRGGQLAGPGAVSYNFEPKGYLSIKRNENLDEQMLALIDLGVEDMEESEDGIDAYVSSSELFEVKNKVEAAGFNVNSAELIQKPKTFHKLEGERGAKAIEFLEALDELDDVQKVFENLDVNT